MKLNFKNEEYKKTAKRIMETKNKGGSKGDIHSLSKAFMILIKAKDKDSEEFQKKNLDNLCKELQFNCYPDLTIDEIYEMTQGRGEVFEKNPEIVSKVILNCAKACVQNGKYLGTNTIEGTKINTSAWMSHSLHSAELAGQFAKMAGVDNEKIQTLALLHDYGRKYTHTFEHVTKGFEKLIDEGWEAEASATLTHSFINGGRCANCEPAEEGFYIDEEGKPKWIDNSYKDDVTEVLENYDYDIYDNILNIVDLMATAEGIVAPYDRVCDIATRKTPDPKNRKYFLSEYINKLNEFLVKMGKQEEFEKVNPTDTEENINAKFKEISEKIFNVYKEQINKEHINKK